MKKLILFTVISLLTTAIYAKTITVTSDADSGTGTLRQAVLDAENGDSIVFADNVVSILLLSCIDIEKNITITGNTENTTVLKRNGDGTDKNFHFYISEESETTFDYLILRDGYVFCSGGAVSNYGTLTLNNCIFDNNRSSDNPGGAIINIGKLFAYNCIFTNNRTPSTGGTIYCRGDAYLEGCTFKNNTSSNNGGVFFISSSSTTTVINCIFEENTGYIGSVISNRGKTIINSCIFRKNKDTDNSFGCVIKNSAEIFITNSIFEEHRMPAIIFNSNANITAINCLFVKNSGDKIINGGKYAVINSTFADNASTCLSFRSGSSDTMAYLYNNIFSHNTIDIYINGEDAVLNAYNNIIENTNGIFNSTNIIGESSLFADNGDYRPKEGSSAIDAGNNSFYPSNKSLTDLAGNNRIDNRIIDIGAYEYQNIGISLNKKNLTMEIGQQEQIIATIKPANTTSQTFHWQSDNESIATVDENGIVTAVGEGTTFITVITKNGEYSASCEIIVKTPISVTGVTLNPQNLTMDIGNQEQLTAIIEPVNATNQTLHWHSNNEKVATVDENGLITAIAKGYANITVTTDDGGFSASCLLTVINPVTSVNLNLQNLTMKIGNQEKLTGSIKPVDATNKKLHWQCDNKDVATVDEYGLVTAINPGTATVTVTTDNGRFSASCLVTVISPVKGVNFNTKSLTIEVGTLEQLIAEIEPVNATNKNLHWQSDNENIATVNENGLVTAVSEGTTVIIVITEDGEFVDVCRVTVKQASIPVTGVILSPQSFTIRIGDQEQLTAIVYPSNATNQNLRWQSNNKNAATIDENGWVTAIAEGITIITVTTEDGEYTATCEVTITGKASISKVNDTSISIYPNPTTGKVQLTSSKLQIRKVDIFDINGRKLSTISSKLESEAKPSIAEVDLSSFAKGVYILRINNDKQIKIIKE